MMPLLSRLEFNLSVESSDNGIVINPISKLQKIDEKLILEIAQREHHRITINGE